MKPALSYITVLAQAEPSDNTHVPTTSPLPQLIVPIAWLALV